MTDPSENSAFRLFSDQLTVAAGTFPAQVGEHIVGPMRRGLKIAVLLDGRQTYELDDDPPLEIEGPALLVALNLGEHIQRRTSSATGQMRCALIQLDLDFAEREFGIRMQPLLGLAHGCDAGVWVRPAGADLRAVALRMAEPTATGSLRSIFVAAQALELAALALDEIIGVAPRRLRRLTGRLREQVQTAHEMLLARLASPPALAELARAVGLNPTKLTEAFRREFGTSVFGYLQEHRLQTAHTMIASGETSVAEAAFRVGYTPAHFSSLFRKRFGMPPSALR